MNVVLVAHRQRAEAAVLARHAASWLEARDVRAWMPDADALALGLPDLAGSVVSDADLADTALAISLGGDGTVLRTVEMIAGHPIPILGVNVGLLGYLTEVEPPAMIPALERWTADRYRVEERMLLSTTVERTGLRTLGLNETVIEKAEPTHTVRMLVRIDGAEFTTYQADGLIIATPTGSTAYSLSARGPIVSPAHRALLITPVSPHMLFDRALVLDPSEEVTVEIIGHRPAGLSVDGRPAAELSEGDIVTLGAAAETARFVRLGDRHFHQILKAKFGLADR